MIYRNDLEKFVSELLGEPSFAAENLDHNCFRDKARNCGRCLSLLGARLHGVTSTAFDAFMTSLDTSCMAVLLVRVV